MPVVEWLNNKLKIYIHKKDHEPMHVHAIHGKNDREAKIAIEDCTILESRGFKLSELKLFTRACTSSTCR